MPTGDFEIRPVENLTPPYTYYNAKRSFVEQFVTSGMPDDVSPVLGKYGTASRHHLRSTLRALRFIDDHNRATDLLKRYARATEQQRRQIFAGVLRTTYPYLLGTEADGFDAINATPQELADKFRAAGVASKSTMGRCIAFFRAAIKDSDMVQDLPQQKDAIETAKDTTRFSRERDNVPPLPPFNDKWPPEAIVMWFEQRALEAKKGK